MDVGKFESLCRRSGLTPVARGAHKAGDVFVAEGFVPFNADTQEVAHWCVIWAVRHIGVDVAQRFPMMIGSTQRERVAEAMRKASEFLAQYHAPANGTPVLAA